MSYDNRKRERERVIPINLNKYINSLSIESTNTNDIFTYINKNRVSKYYSIEAMRLDIEKDIKMLDKINVYSLEENVFSKLWEWVKKIWKKIIDFLKMIWQKIKNFFKGKKGEQVQKKAQDLNQKAQSVKTFDPEEFEESSPYYNMRQDNTPEVSMSDDYIDYQDPYYNMAKNFKKIIKTSFPVIETQKTIENVAVPINYLLEEFYTKHYKSFSPGDAMRFDWNEFLTGKKSPFDGGIPVQIHNGGVSDPDFKSDDLFFYLIYEIAGIKIRSKKLEFDPREIRIYDFFNKDDLLIKFFIRFMATNNLEKNCDKYDTSFLEKEIKKQQKTYETLLNKLEKESSKLKEKGETIATVPHTKTSVDEEYRKNLQEILRQMSRYMEHYQNTIMRKCQMIYLFEDIINKLA